jgi:hypothetical protein
MGLMKRLSLILILLLALGGFWLNSGLTVPPPTAAPPSIPTFNLYHHFTKAFSLSIPQGWYINSHDSGVVVSELGGSALLEVQVVHTGVPLTEASVMHYINAVEENSFTTYTNYRLLEKNINGDCASLRTTLESKNILRQVWSQYCYRESVMWHLTLWVEAARASEYEKIWQTVSTSWQLDTAVVKNFVPYRDWYVATEANQRADFWVPYGWRRVGETFTAPDDLNTVRFDVVENKTDPLVFLQTLYKGVTISTERAASGMRYLTWATPAVRGRSAVAVKEGQLLIFTWSVKTSVAEVFASTGEALLSFYSLR